MQGVCYWGRDLFHMNYILSYNYCNLDKVEYSGTDITSYKWQFNYILSYNYCKWLALPTHS